MKLLPKRQMEVLTRLAYGRKPKEIAADLGVSCKTVEWHWMKLKNKIGVNDYVTATHYALANGLVKNLFK